jgi:hypothetical protein
MDCQLEKLSFSLRSLRSRIFAVAEFCRAAAKRHGFLNATETALPPSRRFELVVALA